jgi:hypothetical protein
MRRTRFWVVLGAVWLTTCEAICACRAGWPSPARAGKRRPPVGPRDMVWRPGHNLGFMRAARSESARQLVLYWATRIEENGIHHGWTGMNANGIQRITHG